MLSICLWVCVHPLELGLSTKGVKSLKKEKEKEEEGRRKTSRGRGGRGEEGEKEEEEEEEKERADSLSEVINFQQLLSLGWDLHLPSPCWDFVCLKLAQTLCLVSQLLCIYTCRCQAVSKKHHFLVVIHCLWFFPSFRWVSWELSWRDRYFPLKTGTPRSPILCILTTCESLR